MAHVRSLCGSVVLTLFTMLVGMSAAMSAEPPPVASNVVALWDEVAANTIDMPPAAVGTPQERVPLYAMDLATVHLAIYEAVNAIDARYVPYAVGPRAPAAGASPEAAASAAAHGVLRGLYPQRATHYEAAYAAALAAIPEGDPKTRGIALGSEVALGILALRADDGRTTTLPAYIAGTRAGAFRDSAPIARITPYLKPFALTSPTQFRAPGPPALASTAYAVDFNEVKALGGASSTVRTPAQSELARFHAEPPSRFWPRNLRQFATRQPATADNARLMALLWSANADATTGCFESKYHYLFWRPLSAIPLADETGNADTIADVSWMPVVPSPNHPEYPAAHACVAGAMAEVLRQFFGTEQVAFQFDSGVAGTTVHRYRSTAEMLGEVIDARVYGGMHFRFSVNDGAVLGKQVAQWTAKRFEARAP